MHKILRQFVEIIVQIGGWAVLAAACLVTYDVVTRKLLNISIAGADEISGYVFAVSTACAFSYALLARANIRIDFVYNLLPGGVQRALDLFSMLMLAGFFAVICYYAYGLAADAVEYGSRSITPLQTPLAIPQIAWFAALVLAFLTAVFLLISAVVSLLKGDQAGAAAVIGIPSLNEEIASEIGDESGNKQGGA